MKRCTICDTSLLNSFTQEVGLLGPPLYWVKDEEGNDVCGWCNDEIHETISENNLDDTIRDEEDDKQRLP